jgi:hypothetical protein
MKVLRFYRRLAMKIKTILLSVLSIGLVTASASSQTPSGDQIDAAATVKARVDTARLAPVKLVSSFDASGKQIVVVSGKSVSKGLAQQKLTARITSVPSSLALMKAKAAAGGTVATTAIVVTTDAQMAKAATVATTAIVVTTDARMGTVAAASQPVVIGKTGATRTVSRGADTLVVSAARARAASTAFSANPLAASIERQVFVGDLPRDSSAASPGLTTGTFATTTGATAIGPNGFPIFLDSTAPQSGTNPIGPNGFPQPLTNGPQAGIQSIGPNGFADLSVPAFAQTGVTRSGVPRDTTVPATTAVGRGATVSTIAAPNAATAVMSGPAVGAAATASPQ